MHSKKVILPVDISELTVKLSRADYALPVVKILIPELARETLLDHRNTNEGAPCLATYETLAPGNVIQNNPQAENIEFLITAEKELELQKEGSTETCAVTLVENITAKIRGFAFTHTRYFALPNRNPADCK